MPHVVFAPGAIRDLQRLREFLYLKSPAAARRAAATILQSLKVLGQQPHIGRLVADMPDDCREWVIDFGDSGYVARYRIGSDAIVVLAIRHQKEVGF